MNEYAFSGFVNGLRKKRGLSMERLCRGLCTFQEISYLETGKRVPDKLLQDAILERLGVGAEDYEHFLNPIEYERWEARQHILHSITFEEIDRAKQLLEQYYQTYVCNRGGCDTRDRLERQFCLSMSAQLCRCQGGSREELGALFQEAVQLTVLIQEKDSIAELALSVKELNLILEAERYRQEGERPERYREIMEYVTSGGLDDIGMAKIYPKAAYFLCRCVMASREEAGIPGEVEERWTAGVLLEYCNRALDILRDGERMYFLWEILEIRGRMLEELANGQIAGGKQNVPCSLMPVYRENEEWKQAVEEIYKEFQLPKETVDYSYLYVMKGVSCISDVIHVRRQMMGMSRKELCEGVCDERTLRRLEKKETVPHKEIATELFERLGLSGEFIRTELATASHEARVLMVKIKNCSNLMQWDQADELMGELRSLISMKERSNQQVVMRKEVLSRWRRGELGREEYCRQMLTALELTIPYDAFLKEGKKYLTHEEQSCIQNRMLGMDRESEEFLTCMLRLEAYYQSYVESGMLETIDGVYEHMMGYVGSEWGNRGELDRADRCSTRILQGCLRFRRMGVVHNCLYDRWWNYTERKKGGIPVEKELCGTEELTKCILFSELAKDKFSEQFYEEKLKAMQ